MPHEDIYRELSECRETGEFVAFHKWGDDPTIFLVGVVRELTPTSATFDEVDPNGVMESSITVPLRLIHTLSRGTMYLWRLKVLHELGPSENAPRELRKPAEIRAALVEAAARGEGVRVWTSADDHEYCLVLSVGEETATFAEILDGGLANGRTILRLRRIVRLRVGGYGERDVARLNAYAKAHGFADTDPRGAWPPQYTQRDDRGGSRPGA
jgi:hypothetical protein